MIIIYNFTLLQFVTECQVESPGQTPEKESWKGDNFMDTGNINLVFPDVILSEQQHLQFQKK